MKVYVWIDRHNSALPRAVMQRGQCSRDECHQFSISISNGELGLTARFESEEEFRQFVQDGHANTSAASGSSSPSSTD
jgi:hypothetical protein